MVMMMMMNKAPNTRFHSSPKKLCVDQETSQTHTHILFKNKYITNRYDEPCCRTNDEGSESIEIFKGFHQRRRSSRTKRRRLKIFTIHRNKCTLPSWCCRWLFGVDISSFCIYLDQFGTNILIFFNFFFMKYLLTSPPLLTYHKYTHALRTTHNIFFIVYIFLTYF